MTLEQWQGLIQAFGFPICSAVALAWALWRIGNKLLESHLSLMKKAEDSMDRANTGLTNLSDNLHTQTSILNSLNHEIVESKKEQVKQTKLLEDLPERNMAAIDKACKYKG